MLKKIVIGLSAVVFLSTAGFGFEGEQEVCQVVKNASNYVGTDGQNGDMHKEIQESCSNVGDGCVNKVITERAKFQSEQFQSKYGVLSTDMLKDVGFSVSVSMNWESVYRNMFEFEGLLSNQDKEEFLKMYLGDEGEKSLSDTVALAELVYKKHIKYKVFYTTSSAMMMNQHKVMKPFFKYIVLKDYARAKKYMYEVNRKNKMSENWKSISVFCDKKGYR